MAIALVWKILFLIIFCLAMIILFLVMDSRAEDRRMAEDIANSNRPKRY